MESFKIYTLSEHWADRGAALGSSLDLTLEILENAGSTVLAAGHLTTPEEAIRIARLYHANALSGDSSQIVQLVLYISTLKPEERADLNINKILYTSEQLTPAQRTFVQSVLSPVEICSLLGSAEAGPYGISSPNFTEGGSASVNQDFVYDTRSTILEILPPEAVEEDGKSKSYTPLPDGEQGVIVQTSLSRFQNPLIRYVTGDIGSVHQLPAQAKEHVPEEDWPHLQVLRLRGRDPRFSFEWDGEYIDFSAITALVQDARYGVLQWQFILHKEDARMDSFVQVRVLIAEGEDGAVRKNDVEQSIRHLLHVVDENKDRFSIVFVDNLEGFVRSGTGRKVVKFVDQFNKKSS
jgi:phenylacetate-coenzyme A ligase PaaK-like adenylate-forming protein